jgi:5-methylcytosine-specific restriction endonuclease McrBC GTP-binding regulatory subunit McrB
VVRTTFHPDSDYSTFVGAYKPKMEVMPRYNPQTGEQMGVEKRIVYAYTPQAFLKAYITAWQNPEQPVYLIIEEINRGNCAQIFGDLFQLLDRGDDGQSCYPIKADQDMQMYLMEAFAGNDALPGNIRTGEELVLPSNLYIWATMNTSDQSLFPIDSAFKRRWEWKYVPITQGRDKDNGQLLQWSIVAKKEKYDWWSFLEVMNKRVAEITSSEDKKLGFFFCKADGQGVISADKFVSKVMFYLWNDVFKDYPENPIAMYLKEDGGEFTYGDFYTTNDQGEAVVREELVKRLLDELGVEEG